MREKKFRVWDKLYKVMREVLSIDLEKKKVICPPRGHEFSEWYNQYLSFDEVLLLQYTGLKDKNGKEIYEGDILQLRNKENKPYHMEVLWTGQGYGYKIIRNETKRSGYIVGHLSERGLNFYNQTAEVIGNIYENPELINS